MKANDIMTSPPEAPAGGDDAIRSRLLAELDRGQEWVAERIAAALPRLSNFIGRKPLQAMYDSHIVNIGICDKQLKP